MINYKEAVTQLVRIGKIRMSHSKLSFSLYIIYMYIIYFSFLHVGKKERKKVVKWKRELQGKQNTKILIRKERSLLSLRKKNAATYIYIP